MAEKVLASLGDKSLELPESPKRVWESSGRSRNHARLSAGGITGKEHELPGHSFGK